jgi:hypothetical protein
MFTVGYLNKCQNHGANYEISRNKGSHTMSQDEAGAADCDEVGSALKPVRIMEPEYKHMLSQYSETFTLRLQVHDMAAKDACRIFGTPAQQAKWLPKLDSMSYIGCYAMVKHTPTNSKRHSL